jgi:transposase
MIVVGLDLHVRNSFLHVEDGDGRRLKRGRVGNSLAELAQFLGALEPRHEPMRVVMESTTNSRAMYGLLNDYARAAGVALSAQVLDARRLRVIAQSVSKCDKLDAAVLAELARSNLKLPACYVPDDAVFALREHLRARADLVRIRTMLKNRVHALLHRRGLPPAGDPFGRAGRAALAALALDAAGRAILDRYLAQLDAIEQAVRASTRELRELSCDDVARWRRPLALLCTMPGVGLIHGLTILAELGDVDRFRSRAAVSNWAGLVPVVRDSNHKRFAGHITRRGSAHLRATMTEAAWSAVRAGPRCRRYGAIFHRIGRVKCKQVAIIAVARRMLEDAWMMLKRDEVFRDDDDDVFRNDDDERRDEYDDDACRDRSSTQMPAIASAPAADGIATRRTPQAEPAVWA